MTLSSSSCAFLMLRTWTKVLQFFTGEARGGAYCSLRVDYGGFDVFQPRLYRRPAQHRCCFFFFDCSSQLLNGHASPFRLLLPVHLHNAVKHHGGIV